MTRVAGGIVRDGFSILCFAVLAQLGLTLLSNAAGLVNAYAHTKLEQGMALDFRSDLFGHAQRCRSPITTSAVREC